MYLYILQNERQIHYIGVTESIPRRIKEHNQITKHFTGKGNHIWKIVFQRYYEKETDARIEEKRLKKAKNKKYIEWYISNYNQLS